MGRPVTPHNSNSQQSCAGMPDEGLGIAAIRPLGTARSGSAASTRLHDVAGLRLGGLDQCNNILPGHSFVSDSSGHSGRNLVGDSTPRGTTSRIRRAKQPGPATIRFAWSTLARLPVAVRQPFVWCWYFATDRVLMTVGQVSPPTCAWCFLATRQINRNPASFS